MSATSSSDRDDRKDKRECKQDEVRDGVRGRKDDDDKNEDA